MSTDTQIKSGRRPSLSRLALAAARELDAHIDPPVGSSREATHALADQLRQLFPGNRPKLPPESIGLICGVVENWGKVAEAGGFDQSTQVAQKVANLLDTPQFTQQQIRELIKFCLALYYATQSQPLIYDIPKDHEGFVSMC